MIPWVPDTGNRTCPMAPVICSAILILNKSALQWRHNERDDVSNHYRHDCLLNRLFRLRSKKTSKFRVTGLCEGNSPVTGEFPAQRASNTEIFPFDDGIMVTHSPGRIPQDGRQDDIYIYIMYMLQYFTGRLVCLHTHYTFHGIHTRFMLFVVVVSYVPSNWWGLRTLHCQGYVTGNETEIRKSQWPWIPK